MLVLGALLVEVRRPRAGAPVLALLAVAGLLRPEAWLFSVAYLLWIWRARRPTPAEIALDRRGAAAVARLRPRASGGALRSLHDTRDATQTLERVTGLGTCRRRSRGGSARSCASRARRRRGRPRARRRLRDRMPAVVGDARARGASRSRCSRPPACRSSPATRSHRGDRRRPVRRGVVRLARDLPGRADGAWTRPRRRTLLFAVFGPQQARKLDRTTDAIAAQQTIRDDLYALLDAHPIPASGSSVANHRLVPLVALATARDPADVVTPPHAPLVHRAGQPDGRPRFILDPRDPVPRVAAAPAGMRAVARNASWVLYRREPKSGPCTLLRSASRAPMPVVAPAGHSRLARGDRLRLLPSGPDLVHEPAPRGTRAISATRGELTPRPRPSKGDSASLERIASDRAPLPPRLARSAE